MMRLNYLKSYDRSFKKLTPSQQENAIKAIDALIELIKTGKKPQGLGLKKVRSDYWEMRLSGDYPGGKGWRGGISYKESPQKKDLFDKKFFSVIIVMLCSVL